MLGNHVLLDISTKSELLKNPEKMCEILKDVAHKVGCTVLFDRHHAFSETNGYTAIIGLAESHISIHTWPEYDFCAVDIFMCGDCDAERAAIMLLKSFEDSPQVKMKIIERSF
jgi:S-adenosylmethionine decarboxylase